MVRDGQSQLAASGFSHLSFSRLPVSLSEPHGTHGFPNKMVLGQKEKPYGPQVLVSPFKCQTFFKKLLSFSASHQEMPYIFVLGAQRCQPDEARNFFISEEAKLRSSVLQSCVALTR